MRTPEEIEKEIEQIEKELEENPDGHRNVGHLPTILVGLRSGLIEARGGVIL